MSRNQRYRNRASDTAMLLTGMAIGAGVMYVFDAESGAGRRAKAGQKLSRGGHALGRWFTGGSMDLANRAWGAVAEFGSVLRERNQHISDDMLDARVRAQLGHVLSHSGDVEVRVRDGEVTIAGEIPADERNRIEKRLRKTRGVRAFHLDVREPSLQGVSHGLHKSGTQGIG